MVDQEIALCPMRSQLDMQTFTRLMQISSNTKRAMPLHTTSTSL